MRSLLLGKLFGIDIELHWTFVLLFGIAFAFILVSDPAQFLPTLTLFVFLFLSVFFHELSHSLMSLYKKIKVHKIILLPIGGVSLSEEFPENPKDEFIIAFVGPLFNFIVVFIILFLVFIFPLPFPWQLFQSAPDPEALQAALIQYPLFGLLWVNFVLGAFNLFLPALPLDGGRVLRSLLAFKLGFVRATQWSAKISSLLAVLLFVYGLIAGGLMVMIIAVFVYFGAQQERDHALLKESLKGFNVTPLIDFHPFILEGDLSMETALTEMLARNQTSFLVHFPDGRYGVINLHSLSSQKSHIHLNQPVYSASIPIQPLLVHSINPHTLDRFLTHGSDLIPVMDENSTLLGVLYAADLEKHFQLTQLKKILEHSK